MASIYLVRDGAKWLHVHPAEAGFSQAVDFARVYGTRRAAERSANLLNAEPVEFREVSGDTAAGALAAAEATIARLREELERLRNQPSTHEAAKRYLEATDG